MVVVAPDAKPHLRTWLVRSLEPICDADPGALADYVSALLDRDESEAELRPVLAGELDEFLEKDGPSFLDQLFNVLRTKSYIPYAATSDAGPSKGAEPMQTDSSGNPPNVPISPRSNRKRPLDDDGSERPPPKGPRLGNYADGRQPPFGPAAMNGAVAPGHMNPNRRQGDPKVFIPPEQMQGICRDYHVKGFCARGALCKFTHDADAMQPMGHIPFPPQFAGIPQQFSGSGMDEGYNPMNPRMDGSMQNRGYAPGMGRYHYTPRPAIANRDDQPMGPGELPVIQDLTPKEPTADGEERPMNGSDGVVHSGGQRMDRPQRVPRFNSHMPPRDRPSHMPPMYGGLAMHGMQGSMGMGMNMMPMDVDNNMSMMAPGRGFPGSHQFNNNMPFGGPQGTFVAPVPGFNGPQPVPVPGTASAPGARPTRREDKTLVVEKIPTEKLSIEAVTGWFQRFGSVTNVAIDRKGGKALVSFEEHQDARAAWKAEDAVFGNRFVKVFWHRPMEGHGALGQKMLAASASAVGKAIAAPSGLKAAESDRQSELEMLVTEQKALMAKVSTLTGEEKKATFAELREVGAKIKAITAGAPAKPAAPSTTDEEKRKMEQLDRELDTHAEGGKESAEGDPAAAGETEALKAQLAKLKAEAESLGIDPANPTVQPAVERGGYSGFRGRGRGRGARGFAPRGGAFARGGARASMKLDNRPKALRISGVSPDKVQGVRDWYEAAGGMDKLDVADNGDLLVYFKSRGSAEQGLAKGMKIPTVGSVGVTWHTGPAHSAVLAAPRMEHDEHMHDTMDDVDELAASAWSDNVEEGAGAI